MTHGICQACAAAFGGSPVENLEWLSASDCEDLPWGVFRLDARGVVSLYNRAESTLARRDPAAVIGRDFFREVAPCTSVEGFRGRFLALAEATGEPRDVFEFLFRFQHGPVRVKVAMIRDRRTAMTTVLVQPLDAFHDGGSDDA